MHIPCPLLDCNFIGVINRFILFLNPVIVILFTGVLIFGGFVYMTAGDNQERIIRARKIIMADIIGLIIVMLAPSIVDLVGSIFGLDLLPMI